MNSEIDAYLKTSSWQKEVKKLRDILADCKLTEEFKWKQPCYTFDGKNIAIIQGFKDFCALMFFKGALLKDSKGFLAAPGENSQSARRFEFTDLKEITKLEATIKSYIKEAISIEEAGLKIDKRQKAEPLPEELKLKFKELPELKKAFGGLTPGRQRAYILFISAAKQSATREARIDKYVKKILQGKGMND